MKNKIEDKYHKSDDDFLFADKNKNPVKERSTVSFEGKEYRIRYFPDYLMYGLCDGGDKPVGRRGSSTKYEPYILNKWYQNKITLIK